MELSENVWYHRLRKEGTIDTWFVERTRNGKLERESANGRNLIPYTGRQEQHDHVPQAEETRGAEDGAASEFGQGSHDPLTVILEEAAEEEDGSGPHQDHAEQEDGSSIHQNNDGNGTADNDSSDSFILDHESEESDQTDDGNEPLITNEENATSESDQEIEMPLPSGLHLFDAEQEQQISNNSENGQVQQPEQQTVTRSGRVVKPTKPFQLNPRTKQGK